MKSNEIIEGRYFVTWTDEHGMEQRRKAIVRNRKLGDITTLCVQFSNDWSINNELISWLPVSLAVSQMKFEAVDPQPMNRQARQWTEEGNAPWKWQSFGEVGFIEAGRRWAEYLNLPQCKIEVRDEFDDVEPVVFHFTRKVQHVCTNPRLGEK